MKIYVRYIHPMMFPVHIGYTASEDEYRKEMKRLGVKDAPPFAELSAATHTYSKGDSLTIIVCYRESEDRTPAQVASLIAHEAVHVWQQIMKHIGCSNAGQEIEAYGIQYITQCILSGLNF